MEAMAPSPPYQVPPPSRHDPELLPLPERQMYDHLFKEAGASGLDSFVHGKQAVEVMSRSGLPKEVLGQIWTLCDPESRGVLYRPHFHLAMRLMTLVQNGYIAANDPTLVGRIRAKDPLSVSLPHLPPLCMAPAMTPASASLAAIVVATAAERPLDSATAVSERQQHMAFMPTSQPPLRLPPQTEARPMPVPMMMPVPSMPMPHTPMSSRSAGQAVVAAGASAARDDIAARMAALDTVVEDHEWDDFQAAEPAAPSPPPPSSPFPPEIIAPTPLPQATSATGQLPPSSLLSYSSEPITSVVSDLAWGVAAPAAASTAMTTITAAQLSPPLESSMLMTATTAAAAAATATLSLLDGDLGQLPGTTTDSPFYSSSLAGSMMAPSSSSMLPYSPFRIGSPHDPFGGPQLVSVLKSNQATHVPTSRFMTESPPSSPPLLPLDSTAFSMQDSTTSFKKTFQSIPSLGAALSMTGGGSISLYDMSPYAESNPYADPDASPQASPSTPPAPSNSSPTPIITAFIHDIPVKKGKDYDPLKAPTTLSSSRSPFSPPPPPLPPLTSSSETTTPPLPTKAYSVANPFQVHEEVVTVPASFSSFTTSSAFPMATTRTATATPSSAPIPPSPSAAGRTPINALLMSMEPTTTTTTTTITSTHCSALMEVAKQSPQAQVKDIGEEGVEEEDWDEFQGGMSSSDFVPVLSQHQTGGENEEGLEEIDPFAGLGDEAAEEKPVCPLAAHEEERGPLSPIQSEEAPLASSSSSSSQLASSSFSPLPAVEENKKLTAGLDDWGEFVESGSMSSSTPLASTIAFAVITMPAIVPVPLTPSWAQPNPWQDPNPWASASLPTQPNTSSLQTKTTDSAYTDGVEAAAPSQYFLASAAATAAAASSASILLSPVTTFAVKDEQWNRQQDKSQSNLSNSFLMTSLTSTTTADLSSTTTGNALEALLGELWERQMLNEAAALTDHLDAVASLPEAKACYERAKAEDQLEEAICLRGRVKELEDKVCEETNVQAWRKAVATAATAAAAAAAAAGKEGGDQGQDSEEVAVVVTLAQLQARVAAVDAGRGEAFAAAFMADQPSLAEQAASGPEGRREAVRRARRARRCCALLEGMDEGGALLAYSEHWLAVLAAAQTHIRQAVAACKHVLVATEKAGGVRKELMASVKILSMVEAALEMVSVARLIFASAADALLVLVLAEEEGLEACVQELQAVLEEMGLSKHFESRFPPTQEAIGVVIADSTEAGALAIDSQAVCNLCLIPVGCARRLGVTMTYFSGHAYFLACLNLWLNAVSREAPYPQLQPQVQREEGEG